MSVLLLAAMSSVLISCTPKKTRPNDNAEPSTEYRAKAEQEYSIGYEYMKQAKYGDASLHFQEAIKYWDKYYAAYIALAQAYRCMRNIVSAESTYHRAKQIDPKDTRAYEGLGVLYFIDLKKYGEAIAEYQAALQLDTTNVDLLNGIAAVYGKTKDFDKALEYYNKSLDYEPENLVTSFAIATIYIDKNEPEKALTYLEALEIKRPDVVDIRKQLGDVYLQLKKYDRAIEEFTWLVLRYPDNTNYHLQLGLIYQRQKKYQSAEKEYEEAKRLAPENPLPFLYLAELGIISNKLNDAEANINEALRLAPGNAYGNILLGDVYERKGLLSKQTWEKNKSKANKNAGTNAVNLLNQAISYYVRGKADEQFVLYADTEIARCNNWNKQLKEDLWYYASVKP